MLLSEAELGGQGIVLGAGALALSHPNWVTVALHLHLRARAAHSLEGGDGVT